MQYLINFTNSNIITYTYILKLQKKKKLAAKHVIKEQSADIKINLYMKSNNMESQYFNLKY